MFSQRTTLKVRDFSWACRRSSCSPTFLGFQRCDVREDREPAARALGLHVSALPAQARPRPPPRAPSPPHSARPRPRAPRSLRPRPPAPASSARGWGSRGCRRLLRPLPLARPLPPSFPCCSRFLPLGLSRPLKVLPNFSSPSGRGGRRRGAGCRAPARPAACPPGSDPRERQAQSGRWRSFPSHLCRPPGLCASAPLRRDSPGLGWLSFFSCSVRPCADSRAGIAAETSLPFRLLRLLPSAPPPPATGINSLGNWGSAAATEDSLSARDSRAPAGPCKQVNAVWGRREGPDVGGRLGVPGALQMTWAKAANANLESAARDAGRAGAGGREVTAAREFSLPEGAARREARSLSWELRRKVRAVWRVRG